MGGEADGILEAVFISASCLGWAERVDSKKHHGSDWGVIKIWIQEPSEEIALSDY